METTVIFATKNTSKIKEINEIMADLGIKVQSLAEAGVDIDVIEDGATFEENAIKKAREINAVTGRLVLADDSGLEVDYLSKEPGIYSARYAGEDTSYCIKNQMIIDRLEGVPDEKRTARFVCAIAAVFPDGSVVTKTETIEGMIGYAEAGANGFGYDPIFYVPKYRCTTAQMPSGLKNRLSHRGKALRAIKGPLEAYYHGANDGNENNE
jgi:XTP/dITP diphosphohydrolase